MKLTINRLQKIKKILEENKITRYKARLYFGIRYKTYDSIIQENTNHNFKSPTITKLKKLEKFGESKSKIKNKSEDMYIPIKQEIIEKLDKIYEYFPTQKDLAKAMGMNPSVITNLINRRPKTIKIKNEKKIKETYEKIKNQTFDFTILDKGKAITEKIEINLEKLRLENQKNNQEQNIKNYKKLTIGKEYIIKNPLAKKDKLNGETLKIKVLITGEYKRFYVGISNNHQTTILKNNLYMEDFKIVEVKDERRKPKKA